MRHCETCTCVNGELAAPGLTPDLLVEAFNAICVPFGLPAVRALSESRRRKAAARLKEHPDAEFWRQVFQSVGRSRFLTGQSSEWRASFDFLINNDRNADRVYEGAYR